MRLKTCWTQGGTGVWGADTKANWTTTHGHTFAIFQDSRFEDVVADSLGHANLQPPRRVFCSQPASDRLTCQFSRL